MSITILSKNKANIQYYEVVIENLMHAQDFASCIENLIARNIQVDQLTIKNCELSGYVGRNALFKLIHTIPDLQQVHIESDLSESDKAQIRLALQGNNLLKIVFADGTQATAVCNESVIKQYNSLFFPVAPRTTQQKILCNFFSCWHQQRDNWEYGIACVSIILEYWQEIARNNKNIIFVAENMVLGGKARNNILKFIRYDDDLTLMNERLAKMGLWTCGQVVNTDELLLCANYLLQQGIPLIINYETLLKDNRFAVLHDIENEHALFAEPMQERKIKHARKSIAELAQEKHKYLVVFPNEKMYTTYLQLIANKPHAPAKKF